jgi:pyridoxine 5-phosphate synthase
MKKLGVNIDHIATLRNARGEDHPNILFAAKYAYKKGADSITIHLREDRRHIKDYDLKQIVKTKIPLNLELAASKSMVKIALKNKPDYICIVPEKRKEITTEGGLNLKKNTIFLKKIIKIFNSNKIRTSLFIDPNIKSINLSKDIGTKCVELHTGNLSTLIKKKLNYSFELEKIKKCALLGKSLGIEVHAGHGMDYKTTKILSKINEISEFNIGHFLIGESIFNGLGNTIKKFKNLMK